MLPKRLDLPFWLSVGATALLMFVSPARRAGGRPAWKGLAGKERPFGEPQSSDEPYDLELRRAHERGRGRHATHPLEIPWSGWYDIFWRTYREMNSDRLLSIAGGVSFFVLLADLSSRHCAGVGLRAVLQYFHYHRQSIATQRCCAR